MRSSIGLLLLGAAVAASLPASAEEAAAPVPAAEVARARARYAVSVRRLLGLRRRFVLQHRAARGARRRAAVLARVRRVLERAITDDLLPAWIGTPWDYNGTSNTPGSGRIACGYLVSTVLRDAGFRIERVRLAQQPAERIAKTLAPERAIRRFRRGDVSEVVAAVRRAGAGLYLVGLDYHVGFLVHRSGRVDLCHSSVLPPGSAVCEPADGAAAMASRYHVVGKLLTERMLVAWLYHRPIPTRVR